jgi:hypothetical protein
MHRTAAVVFIFFFFVFFLNLVEIHPPGIVSLKSMHSVYIDRSTGSAALKATRQAKGRQASSSS